MVVVLNCEIGSALTFRRADRQGGGRWFVIGRRPLSVRRKAGSATVNEGVIELERIGAELREVLRGALERSLVLASASPRRADLLTQVGIAYEVRVSEVAEEEDVPGADPVDVAEAHARQKALDVALGVPERVVLGADTVVVLGGRSLGKPGSAAEAREMLAALSGRTHEVITGVALALGHPGDGEVRACLLQLGHVRTAVRFRDLSSEEIEAYVACGEPMDKAGAYGIQGRGALLVREISGCYFNVVGLPLSRTWEMLASVGYEIPWTTAAKHRGRRS